MGERHLRDRDRGSGRFRVELSHAAEIDHPVRGIARLPKEQHEVGGLVEERRCRGEGAAGDEGRDCRGHGAEATR